MITTLPLGQIEPNPYQTRQREDPEHIQHLALSIAEHGLLQIPTARQHANAEGLPVYQLAFGHSRLAAFTLLNDAGNPGFSAMPLNVIALTELQMFEQAVAENHERKDLSPIEEATAMQVYRETFGKTSVQIGELFHLSESAVRNKLRLLDLPEQARGALGAGQLSEGNARALLTMQRLAPAEQIDQVTQLVAGQNFSPLEVEEKIEYSLKNVKEAKEMWGKWHSAGGPRGGSGLWPLEWKPEHSFLDFKAFQAAYKGSVEPKQLKRYYEEATFQIRQYRLGIDVIVNRFQIPRDVVELAYHLTSIPACTACPFYARLNGTHWCGMKACWVQKRTAWYISELNRVAEETGIRILSTDDGPIFEESSNWGDRKPLFQEWMEQKDRYLRLRIHYSEYGENSFTNNYCVQLVTVHPDAIARIQAQKEKEKMHDQTAQERENQYELQRQKDRASAAFINQVAMPIFARVLAPLEHLGFWEWIVDGKSEKETRKEKLQEYQFFMMGAWLQNKITWAQKREGPVSIAKHLQGIATSWGLELPADWLDQAERYEPGYQAPADEPVYEDLNEEIPELGEL